MTYLTREPHCPFGPSAERFNELLGRYPRMEPDEVEEMIAIYPKLTILEVGLLSGDDALARPLDSFRRDHSERLKSSWRHHLVFALSVIVTFAMFGALIAAAMG